LLSPCPPIVLRSAIWQLYLKRFLNWDGRMNITDE
jgi:hypothetical protein